MPTEAAEVRGLLLSELKIKRQELDVVKLDLRCAVEKTTKWKERAKAAEAERDKLRSCAIEKNGKADHSFLARYKERAVDAEKALENYKQDAENTLKKTHDKSRDLEIKLAQTKKDLEESDAELTRMASRMEKYKQRMNDAVAAQRAAESECKLHHDQSKSGSGDLDSRDATAIPPQIQASQTGGDLSSFKKENMLTVINRVLHSLPIVESYPAGDLKPIGGKNGLDKVTAMLPKETIKTAKYWKAYRFPQVRFEQTLHHGYMLRSRCSIAFDAAGRQSIHCEIDPLDGLLDPFEAFVEKNGMWYYMGTYQGFHISEVSPGELSPSWKRKEILHLVRDTIKGDKKAKYLSRVQSKYAQGELTAVCLGLRCVGFNVDLYKCLLKAAEESRPRAKNKASTKKGTEGEAGVKRKKRPISNLGQVDGNINKRRRVGHAIDPLGKIEQ